MTKTANPADSSTAQSFANALELLRTEGETVIQYHMTWTAVLTAVENDNEIKELLHKSRYFWSATLNALQLSTFIAIGRIFDPNTENHRVDDVLSIAIKNTKFFSWQELEKRQPQLRVNETYVATLTDFDKDLKSALQRLKDQVAKQREVYDKKYRPIRNEVFAHRGVKTQTQINELFNQTNISEFHQLIEFPVRLHSALSRLYLNGEEPVLPPIGDDVQALLASPAKKGLRSSLQKDVLHDTKDFLKRCIKPA